MAISVTTNLIDGNLSEATTNYAVLGTWATGIAASVDTYVQSSATVGGRVSANTAWAHTTLPSSPVDLSSNGYHIFQWLKCISIPQLDTKANGGLGVTLSSDATPTYTGTTPSDGPTNSKTWYVGGNADALSGWVCYVIDPTSTPNLTLGSPNVSALQRIGIRGKVVGTVGGGAVKPVNVVFDATRYGTGLTYTGDTSGTPGTFADILTTAMSSANAWGILTSDSSIYFGAGKFNFGTTGQTAISSFKSTGDLFVWRNFPVNVTFYEFLMVGAASFATTFQIGNYSGGLSSDGSVIKGAGNLSGSTHSVWSLTVGSNTTINIYGSQFSELYRATLQSSTTIRDTGFNNFGNIIATGALIDNCTFQNLRTTTPISATYAVDAVTTVPTLTNCKFVNCATALRWPMAFDPNGKLDGTTFTSGGTGHAIEFTGTATSRTLTNVTFTGYSGTSTNAAIFVNITEGSMTLTIAGTGTDVTGNVRTAGATVTVVASTKTVKVAVTKVGGVVTGANVFLAATDGGPFPSGADPDDIVTISSSGTTATVSHTGHGMATGDQINIDGITNKIEDNNGVHTITWLSANSYTYTTTDTGPTTYTGTIKVTFVFLKGIADSPGGTGNEISMSRSIPSSQPVVGWARKSTSFPYFKEGAISGAVSSTGDTTFSPVLISDD